jgi:hypothetical protein
LAERNPFLAANFGWLRFAELPGAYVPGSPLRPKAENGDMALAENGDAAEYGDRRKTGTWVEYVDVALFGAAEDGR